MNHVATHLNIIMYKVGQGGNFLGRLFGLSEKTQFLWVRGTCGCRPKDHSLGEKLKYYWYFPEKIVKWLSDAHLTPYGLHLCHTHPDIWETNPIIISCIHYEHLHLNAVPDHLKTKYFFVQCNDTLYQQMKDNVSIAFVNDEEYDENFRNTLKQTKDTDHIDLELLINPETFEMEYRRVCKSMGLEPIDTETALSFLNNWKQHRIDKPKQS